MMYMITDNEQEYLSLQEHGGGVAILYKYYKTEASLFIKLSISEARQLGAVLVKWADTGSFDNDL